MSVSIHILSSSEKVRPHESKLRSVCEASVREVSKILPIKDVDVVFYVNPGATIDEQGGIGAFTPNQNTIFISLDPSHADFANALTSRLPFILAHEFHHTIRWQKTVEGDTLLEAMIFEGLADHFAMRVTGEKVPSPWSSALSDQDKDEYMKKASLEWLNPSHDQGAWFFGATPEVIPRWAAYSLGFELVGRYIKFHPDYDIAELAVTDASLFI